VYAYCSKIYSSRRIAAALRENIRFMWLSGGNRPDFRTINDFRGQRMKDVIDEVCAEVLKYLIEAGYVRLEHYFTDGTKIAADANQHKVVWAKRTQRYQQGVRAQIGELLQQIEQANADGQAENGDADLEERGPAGGDEIDAADTTRRCTTRTSGIRRRTIGRRRRRVINKPRRRIRIEFGAKGRPAARLACADHCRVQAGGRPAGRPLNAIAQHPCGISIVNSLTAAPSRSIMS
jgi:hypothetical protein